MTEIGDEGRHPERWHVNRGIPVVFLLSSLVWGFAQVGVFGWYASQFNMRVETVEKAQNTATQAFDKLQASTVMQGERLTRLEEKVVAVQAGVNRIEALLTKPVTR